MRCGSEEGRRRHDLYLCRVLFLALCLVLVLVLYPGLSPALVLCPVHVLVLALACEVWQRSDEQCPFLGGIPAE